MREYRQLTEEDRIEIYAMKQAGKPQNMMAVKLGVHPSMISREHLSKSTKTRFPSTVSPVTNLAVDGRSAHPAPPRR